MQIASVSDEDQIEHRKQVKAYRPRNRDLEGHSCPIYNGAWPRRRGESAPLVMDVSGMYGQGRTDEIQFLFEATAMADSVRCGDGWMVTMAFTPLELRRMSVATRARLSNRRVTWYHRLKVLFGSRLTFTGVVNSHRGKIVKFDRVMILRSGLGIQKGSFDMRWEIELSSVQVGKSPWTIQEVVSACFPFLWPMVRAWAEFLWLPQPSFLSLCPRHHLSSKTSGMVIRTLKTQAHSKCL